MAQANLRDSLVTLLLLRAEGEHRSLLTRGLLERVVSDAGMNPGDLEVLPSRPLHATAHDLDGDGAPELFLTHPMWCGTAGCATWVYRRAPWGYHLVLEATDARPLPTRTRGIRDLVATIHFGAPSSCDFIYRFRGLGYHLHHVVARDAGKSSTGSVCPFEDAE